MPLSNFNVPPTCYFLNLTFFNIITNSPHFQRFSPTVKLAHNIPRMKPPPPLSTNKHKKRNLSTSPPKNRSSRVLSVNSRLKYRSVSHRRSTMMWPVTSLAMIKSQSLLNRKNPRILLAPTLLPNWTQSLRRTRASSTKQYPKTTRTSKKTRNR